MERMDSISAEEGGKGAIWGQIFCCARRWARLGMLPPRVSPKKSGWLCRDTTQVNVGHDIVARFLAPFPPPILPYP